MDWMSKLRRFCILHLLVGKKDGAMDNSPESGFLWTNGIQTSSHLSKKFTTISSIYQKVALFLTSHISQLFQFVPSSTLRLTICSIGELKAAKSKRSHLNRYQIESNLSVPGIQGYHENALYKSFETSPLLTCL